MIRRLRTALGADRDFAEILSGSFWSLGAKAFAALFGIAANVIVARWYGAEMVGFLAIIAAVVMFGTMFSLLGMNTAALRLLPEHIATASMTSAYRIYLRLSSMVGAASIACSVVLYFASPAIATRFFGKPELTWYLQFTAAFLIVVTFMNFHVQVTRGLRLIRWFAFLQMLPQAAMVGSLLLLAWLWGHPQTPVFAQGAAWSITAATAALLVFRTFRSRRQQGEPVTEVGRRELLRMSLPMLMTASMSFVIGQTGVVLLTMYTTAAEVGLYAVAVKLALLTSFVLQAINSMSAPKFSELFHTGRIDALFVTARKSARLIFWSTVPILLVLALAGRFVLERAFGLEFAAAYPAMLILIIGQAVHAVSGSTGIFMNMTGHESNLRNYMMGAAVLNVLLGLLLVPRFGTLGAACAAAASLSAWNVAVLVFIQRRFSQTIAYFPGLTRISGGV